MEANINIKLWGDEKFEAWLQCGLSVQTLENIIMLDFEKFCKEMIADSGYYSVDVKVIEGVE